MIDFDLFDENGYPTKESLEYIKKYPILTRTDCEELMKFVQSLWHWGETYCYKDEKNSWHLITGGWSGNEDIIFSLQSNLMFMAFYWDFSYRGGLHVFGETDIDNDVEIHPFYAWFEKTLASLIGAVKRDNHDDINKNTSMLISAWVNLGERVRKAENELALYKETKKLPLDKKQEL